MYFIASSTLKPSLLLSSPESSRMEENSFLFSLSINQDTKSHLSEMAKWAKFLAIAGFVFLILLIFAGVYASLTINHFEEGFRDSGFGDEGTGYTVGAGIVFTYGVMAFIAFFPLLFTYRFANTMQEALRNNDQPLLNAAFKNLKDCFRYLGIVTIILLSLFALSLVFGIAGLALS